MIFSEYESYSSVLSKERYIALANTTSQISSLLFLLIYLHLQTPYLHCENIQNDFPDCNYCAVIII